MLIEARRPGQSVGLLSYAWDDRLRNYVDLSTGRMVKRELITDLLRTVIAGAERRMGLLGELVAQGQITPRQFYELMAREIKLATNVSAALASGGWQNVSFSAWGRNGALIRAEYGYLRGFVQEIGLGGLSEAQIIARAKLYGNTAYGRFWEIEQAGQQARGMRLMKLLPRMDDRTCPVCIAEAKRGWQPVGTWIIPLHPACRCDALYSA